ncbi:MAG: putative exosome complex RNA-binding protein 1 [archaeon GW2011_AR20]|nr:MAG: putative exosome complex RNA-binding protein 1 [archaeon GW2011_AR20]MBS3161032.1 RNA-binding protein [Candidatus Woesearchaeota archaeon]
MTKLLINEREIVVPGEELAEGMDFLPSHGTYRDKDKIVSSKLGVVSVNKTIIKVIPLTGRYMPKIDDIVIGRVIEIGFYGWSVDIGSAYPATLSIRDATEFIDKGENLTKYYDYGDILAAQVIRTTRYNSIDITTKGPGLKKLSGGKVIEVTPSKVPRMIGKQGSMISMIKDATGCNILIGQNGRVWIKGTNLENENLVTKTIMKIEEESHIDGLTDKIKKLLESKK